MNTLKKFGKWLLRVIGYLLMGLGGLVIFASVLSVPFVLLSPEMDMGLGERLIVLLCFILYAAVFAGIYYIGARLAGKTIKKSDIKKNREEFQQIYADLFKDGTLREAHRGKTLSIYAVAEQCYVVIPFTGKLPENAYIFLLIDDQQVPEMIQNEGLFDQIFESRKSKDEITVLREESKAVLQQHNQQRLEKGIRRITPESENALLGKTLAKPKAKKASGGQHDVVRETRENVSGTLRASSPKYQTIESAIKLLEQYGFSLVKIITDGETSSHMWCVGFDKEYESFQAFNENVYADFRNAASGNGSGPNLEWASTSFRLVNADDVLVCISIAEDNGDAAPRTTDFHIWVPEAFPPEKKTEIMRIRDALAAL